MIAEKTAGILERVRLVKDEAILDAVTNILDAYLHAQVIIETGKEEIPYFDPLKYHSSEAVADFEAQEDFIGYATDGTPLYGREEAEKADRFIEGMLDGTVKAVTHEELKLKMEAKFEAWRQRTK